MISGRTISTLLPLSCRKNGRFLCNKIFSLDAHREVQRAVQTSHFAENQHEWQTLSIGVYDLVAQVAGTVIFELKFETPDMPFFVWISAHSGAGFDQHSHFGTAVR